MKNIINIFLLISVIFINESKSLTVINYNKYKVINIENTLFYVDTIDIKAVKNIDSNLQIIKKFVLNFDFDSTGRQVYAVNILEDVTDIKSEAEFTWYGKLCPTFNDYKRWTIWFLDNYDRLYWDEKDKKVKIKEKERKNEDK